MTPEELRAELDAGRLRPGYLLAGAEPLLRDEALAALREAVLAGTPSDFDCDRLEGDATAPAALRDALGTLPVLTPRRLVWLREPTGGRGAGRALLEALPGLLAELPSDARSVLVVTARNADARTAWVRAFAAAGAVVQCEAPRGDRALASFVRGEARRQGIALGSRAAERLAERVGPQLLVIRNELAKAALLAGPGGRVEEEHVVAAVADVADEPVWELTDAIGDGRAGEALGLLGRMLDGGAPAPLLLGTLAAHFRKLARLRSGGRVAAPPFVRNKLASQAERYSPGRLLGCLRAIHQTDERLKGHGGAGARLALERLVLGLAA